MFDTERVAFTGWKDAAAKNGYEMDLRQFEKTLGVGVAGVRDIFTNHFGNEFPFAEIRADRLNIAEEIIKTKGVPVKKAVATSTSRDRALNLLREARIDIFLII